MDMIKTFSKIIRQSTKEKAPIWRAYVTLKNFDTFCNETMQWHPPSHEVIASRWENNPEDFKKCEE